MKYPNPAKYLRSPKQFSRLLCIPVLALGISSTAWAGNLIFETAFNSADQIELEDGARLGPPGSGVSGKDEDKSLQTSSDPAAIEPVALIASSIIPIQKLEELTITAWYKPAGVQKSPTVLFNAFGSLLIWEPNKTWTLRLNTKDPSDPNKRAWFASGNAPDGGWMAGGGWNFIAIVWKRDGNSSFYHGTVATPALLAREQEGGKFLPLSETDRPVRTIGNDPSKRDRAFNGNIDDVRFYSKALDYAAIEKIRVADIKNQPAPK